MMVRQNRGEGRKSTKRRYGGPQAREVNRRIVRSRNRGGEGQLDEIERKKRMIIKKGEGEKDPPQRKKKITKIDCKRIERSPPRKGEGRFLSQRGGKGGPGITMKKRLLSLPMVTT